MSYAGQAQSGKSNHYQIKMIAKTNSSKLSFENLWVGTQFLNIKAYTLENNWAKSEFEKGDTIYIDAYQRFLPNDKGGLEAQKTEQKTVPMEYQGQALLEYKYKGKSKYWIISEITSLPSVYYP